LNCPSGPGTIPPSLEETLCSRRLFLHLNWLNLDSSYRKKLKALVLSITSEA
jgi:hypothetical protein